jgi:hypothetical protein
MILLVVAFFALLFWGFYSLAWKRRRFDLPALAFFCAAIYFLPGITGNVILPLTAGGLWIEQPIIPQAYGVYVLVLGATLAAAHICDRMETGPEPEPWRKADFEFLGHIATIGAIVGFIWCVAQNGSELLLTKEEFLPKLSPGYKLWTDGATFGAIIAFAGRRKILFAICVTLLVLDLYIGFRINAAMAVVCILFYQLHCKGHGRIFIEHFKLALIALPSVFILLLYKQVVAVIKLGRWDLLFKNISNPENYRFAVFQSEPYVTQLVLHETLRQHFHTDPSHLFIAVSQIIPFGTSLFGRVTTYDELFHHALFSGYWSNLANNFWAEMWSSGGWLLVLGAALMFGFLLVVGERCLRTSSGVLKIFWIYFWTYFAFYIHRNDLVYQIYLQRRAFIYPALFAIVAIAIRKIRQNLAETTVA